MNDRELLFDIKNRIEEHFKHQGIANVIISRDIPTGVILLSYSGQTEKELDVQFKFKGTKKWHSIAWMLKDDLDPDELDYNPPRLPEQSDGHHEYMLHPPREKAVSVRFVEGFFSDAKNEFVNEKEHAVESFEGYVEPKPEPTEPSWKVLKGKKLNGSVGLLGVEPDKEGIHPSANPNDWTAVKKDLLHPNNVNGIMAKLTSVFAFENGVGLFYNSKPWHEPSPKGSATQCGAVAFSFGGSEFIDYPKNPVLWDVPDWAHPLRLAVGCVLYNPENETYYAPYVNADIGNEAGYFGERALGLAWTKDMIHWEQKTDSVWFTHNNARQIFPNLANEYDWDEQKGRIYVDNGLWHDGYYYLKIGISAKGKKSGDRWIRFRGWDGKIEPVEFDDSGVLPESSNLFQYDKKWYSAFTSSERVHIISSDNLLGPYNFITGDKGIGLFEETEYPDAHLERSIVYKYDDVWYILYGIRESQKVDRKYDVPHGATNIRVMKMGYFDPNGKLNK